jgi:hypothetical protein
MTSSNAIRHGRGGAPDAASIGRTEPSNGWTLRIAISEAAEPTELRGLTVRQALARLDAARVHEIKREIASGTYLTEAKLNAAIDRLVAALEVGADATERATA